MTRTPTIFLTISIIAFALSFTPADNFGWGILKPVGAIAFILFFVTRMVTEAEALEEKASQRKPSH